MAKVGTAYVDIVGNFAPLNKQLKSSSLRSRFASIAKVGTLAVAGIGIAAIKSAADFDHSMQLISTQAGASRKEVDKMKQSVLDLSGKTIFAPQALADALFHVESVGFRGAEAMKVLNNAQKLATVGNSDLESTTYALTSALETGIKGTKNMHNAIGLLNAIVGTGDLRMQDLTSSLSTGILPSAKAAGLGLRDVGAALDVMTARGVPAQAAATRLRMTFSLLGAQTPQASKVLGNLGIKAGQLGEILQKQGLVAAVQLLADHLGNAGDKAAQFQAISDAFGGGRSSSAILTLIQNVDDLRGRYDQIGKSAGNFDEKLREAKMDPTNQIKNALANIQVALVRIGDGLAPAVAGALQDVSKVLTDPNTGFGEKISKLSELLSHAVSDAGPQVAKAAVGVGGEITKGVFSGFVHSDPLGKLAITAALISLFGGKTAWAGIGRSIGGTVSRSIPAAITSPAATKAAASQTAVWGSGWAGAAGTEAGTSFGSRMTGGIQTTIGRARGALGGYMTGVGSRMGGTMAIAIGSQLAAAALPQGVITDKISAWGTSAALGFAIGGPWGALGGVAASAFADALGSALAGPDIKSEFATRVEELTNVSGIGKQVQISKVDVDAIRAKVEERIKESGSAAVGSDAWAEAVQRGVNAGMAKAAAKIKPTRATAKELFGGIWDDLTPDQQQFAQQFRSALVEANKLFQTSKIEVPADILQTDPKMAKKLIGQMNDVFRALHDVTFSSLQDIQRVVDGNLKTIDKLYPTHGDKWREAMAQTMRAQVEAIHNGIDRGAISMKNGMDKIHDLIAKANLLDPTKKQVHDFAQTWANGMDRTNEVTNKGIHTLIQHLGKLPDEARQIAVKQMLARLEVARNEGQLTDKAYDKIRSNILSHYVDMKGIASDQSEQMVKNVLDSYKNLDHGVNVGLNSLKGNVNKALKALGLNKPVQFRTNEAPIGGGGVGHPNTREGGEVLPASMATGGLAGIVPGTMPGDRHTLMLNGRPLAKVESKEGIFVGNRTLMAEMAARNAEIPRRQEGGFVNPWGRGLAQGGLTFPLTGAYTWGRIDQGVDFGGTATIRAMGDAIIKSVGSGWPGGGGILYQLLGGAPKGFGISSPYIYDYEHVNATVRPGQKVAAGQPIGQLLAGFPGLEQGYASPSGGTLAQATSGYSEGQVTPAGQSMYGLLKALSHGKLITTAAVQVARELLKGPPGAATDEGQAALDKAWHAANAFLAKQSAEGATGTVNVPGGNLSKQQLMSLWSGTGQGGDPNVMAAIALAESGGDPSADNGIARGLWQIIQSTWSAYGKGSWDNAFDPNMNAQAAHNVLAGSGLGAWDTYSSGAYRQFLKLGGLVEMLKHGGGIDNMFEYLRTVERRDYTSGRDKVTLNFLKTIGELGMPYGSTLAMSQLSNNMLLDEDYADRASQLTSILSFQYDQLDPALQAAMEASGIAAKLDLVKTGQQQLNLLKGVLYRLLPNKAKAALDMLDAQGFLIPARVEGTLAGGVSHDLNERGWMMQELADAWKLRNRAIGAEDDLSGLQSTAYGWLLQGLGKNGVAGWSREIRTDNRKEDRLSDHIKHAISKDERVSRDKSSWLKDHDLILGAISDERWKWLKDFGFTQGDPGGKLLGHILQVGDSKKMKWSSILRHWAKFQHTLIEGRLATSDASTSDWTHHLREMAKAEADKSDQETRQKLFKAKPDSDIYEHNKHDEIVKLREKLSKYHYLLGLMTGDINYGVPKLKPWEDLPDPQSAAGRSVIGALNTKIGDLGAWVLPDGAGLYGGEALKQIVEDLQGSGGLMNQNPNLPHLGSVGGKVLELQAAIATWLPDQPFDTSSPFSGGSDSGTDDSAKLQLTQDLLDDANKRLLVKSLIDPVLEAYINPPDAPYAGIYHAGGVVPGPLGAERTITALGGEVFLGPNGVEGASGGTNVIIEDGAVNADRIRFEAAKETSEATFRARHRMGPTPAVSAVNTKRRRR